MNIGQYLITNKGSYSRYMEITLNNRPEKIPGKDMISVSDLLKHKNFTFKFLVVRVNDNTVKTDEYNSVMIRNGDDVKVIHLISGG